MRHLIIFTAILMATGCMPASSAAAPVLTSPAGTEYTGGLHATLATPNTALLKAGIEDTCGESTVRGTVVTNNATHASGQIFALSFNDCTKTTDVIKHGSLEIGNDGVVTAIGNEVTVFDPKLGSGVSCIYGGGAGTILGTLKGGAPAVLEVSTSALPKLSGGILCNSTGTWTAKYTVTTPSTLLVDKSTPPPGPGVLTSPSGTDYTGELHATQATPNTALLKAGIEDTCGESTVWGYIETNGGASASGELSLLAFADCTKTTLVLKTGSLSVAGGGALTAKDNEVTVFDLSVSCVYGGGNGTKLGTLKGGTPAVLEVNTTELPKISGGFLCASKGTWSAKYTVTVPSTLLVDSTIPSSGILTSPAGTHHTGELHATLATPSSALLKAGIEDTCGESTVKGNVETNSETSASSKISVLTFGDCTKPTTVLSNGGLVIGKGGVVTAVGSEVTIFDLGVSCVYGGGAGTKLGTLKGGTPAVLEASTTELPKLSGGFLCASKGTWIAKYTVTTPAALLVD